VLLLYEYFCRPMQTKWRYICMSRCRPHVLPPTIIATTASLRLPCTFLLLFATSVFVNAKSFTNPRHASGVSRLSHRLDRPKSSSDKRLPPLHVHVHLAWIRGMKRGITKSKTNVKADYGRQCNVACSQTRSAEVTTRKIQNTLRWKEIKTRASNSRQIQWYKAQQMHP
jgi:hypothetical protein